MEISVKPLMPLIVVSVLILIIPLSWIVFHIGGSMHNRLVFALYVVTLTYHVLLSCILVRLVGVVMNVPFLHL